MTAPALRSTHNNNTSYAQAVNLSGRPLNRIHGPILRELPSNSRGDGRAGQSIFFRMLWLAFPARSENQLAEMAAPVLGVTDKQVRNWLRGQNDGKTEHLVTLIALVGVEKLARMIEGSAKKR